MSKQDSSYKHRSLINRLRKTLRESNAIKYRRVDDTSFYETSWEFDTITMILNSSRLVIETQKTWLSYLIIGLLSLSVVTIMLLTYFGEALVFWICLPIFILLFLVSTQDTFSHGKKITFDWNAQFISVENNNVFVRLFRLRKSPNNVAAHLRYFLHELTEISIEKEQRARDSRGRFYWSYCLKMTCAGGSIVVLQHSNQSLVNRTKNTLETLINKPDFNIHDH